MTTPYPTITSEVQGSSPVLVPHSTPGVAAAHRLAIEHDCGPYHHPHPPPPSHRTHHPSPTVPAMSV
ncbi:hypothetical protein J6590_055006 [Homalodisca vitripennis]|nr:hypothetical protein J6590_055006 [Homalodisca vitripennis]